VTRQVFTLPDLGEGLTEAELVRWLVAVGDTVAVDAPVAEVETAKASVEVPSPYAGVIAELHGAEGTTIEVGAPLVSVEPGAVGSPAAVEPSAVEAPAVGSPGAAAYVEEERAGSGNVLIGFGTSERPRSRRHRRRDAARPAGTRSGSVAGERPKVASPVVRQLARQRGLDLGALTGTGPDGLIIRADVERAGTTPAADTAAGGPLDSGVDRRTGLPVGERVPLRGVRKAVAETLARSRREIPEATTWVDVDATALVDLRRAMADDGRDVPGLLAFVAGFVVSGLRRFPQLNARVDTERGEVLHLDGVNLGIAAQTERGLVVPAVRAADRLSLRALDTEIRRLTAAAREGTATAAELGGGSFTLNNYGVLGVDGSAAIINHPEVAILGMGRILPRPWVVDGEIVPRQLTQLSLVFDHRVCDGGTAAGFLRYVADAIESPLHALVDR
jgi:pyruvate dehydrogenase E2 component (dihydrolipoamide acetyltransferase)